MRLLLLHGLIVLVMIWVSCSSYDEKRKTEAAVEHAVDKFHEQLNQEQYHDIYSQADSTLQNRLSQAEFTSQIRNAHEQLGSTSGKAFVRIDDSVWRGIRRTFGNKREIVNHGNSPGSDVIAANERFAWAVENDQPKLVSYDFQVVCKRPCQVGYGR